MANIYDIAKIISGDPIGREKDKARGAGAYFQQILHQKDIIKQINEAIADAKRKSKKGKLGSSILGSLLGMGAGALTGRMAAPWAKVLGALGSGAGAGIAEKFRQDKYKPTQKLKELKQKLKGRSQYEDVAATEEVFSDQLDAMMQGDVMSNILASLIMPYSVKGAKEAEQLGVSEAVGDVTKEIYEAVPDAASLGSIDATGRRLAGAGASESQAFIPREITEAGVQFETPFIDIPAVPGKLGIGFDPKMFKAIMPKMFEGLADEEFMKNPIILSLLRAMGPSAYGALSTPKVTSSPYAQPQFRNPYRGGY